MMYELFLWLYPLLEATPGSFIRLLKYVTVRSALAMLFSCLFLWCVCPAWIRFLKSKALCQGIRFGTPATHKEKAFIPTMGGIPILCAIVFMTLVWGRLDSWSVYVVLLVTLFFGGIGYVDDRLKFHSSGAGLRSWLKFRSQFIVALFAMIFVSQGMFWDFLCFEFQSEMLDILAKKGWFVPFSVLDSVYSSSLFSLQIPFFERWTLELSWGGGMFFVVSGFPPLVVVPLYWLFGICVIVGTSNAVNLTDGLDGLASGLLVLSGIALGCVAYVSGTLFFAEYLKLTHIRFGGELTVLCSSFVGATLGFLWFNAHPAEIFMGDTGSLSLGAMLGVLAVLLRQEILLLFIGGVFVVEVCSVVLQVGVFKLTKKRVFKVAPLHHHFEALGWSESKVIIRFWIIGALLCLCALLTFKIR